MAGGGADFFLTGDFGGAFFRGDAFLAGDGGAFFTFLLGEDGRAFLVGEAELFGLIFTILQCLMHLI